MSDGVVTFYAKFKNWKHFFLVMYVVDILLSSSDVCLLLQTKNLLSSNLTSLYILVKHHSFKELKFIEI
jgi:hypothetical protein